MKKKDYSKNTELLLEALVRLIPNIRKRHDIGFSKDDREDALMDAITKLLEREKRISYIGDVKKKEFFSSKRAAQQYAIKMVRNRLIDMLRKEKRHEDCVNKIEEGGELCEYSINDKNLHLFIEADRLLSNLKDKDILLIKAYFTGEPYFTWHIKSQNLKRGTARVRIHRILKKLREISGKN